MRLLIYENLRSEKGIPYTRSHIWRLCKAGKFPQPIKLTPNGVNHWPEPEIDAHIETCAAARDQVAR
jgi:predicted DNA-binding transcriptional regulator AlpA